VPVCVAGAALCLWVSAGAALWVCALGVAVGVCVPVVRPAALSVSLCGRFCAVWCCGVCAVVCAYALCCSSGVCFVNKNKGLQCFLNEKDYMRFYLPVNYFIISIMSLPLFDYLDYIISIISVLFCVKKTPPSKSFGSSFFNRV